MYLGAPVMILNILFCIICIFFIFAAVPHMCLPYVIGALIMVSYICSLVFRLKFLLFSNGYNVLIKPAPLLLVLLTFSFPISSCPTIGFLFLVWNTAVLFSPLIFTFDFLANLCSLFNCLCSSTFASYDLLLLPIIAKSFA